MREGGLDLPKMGGDGQIVEVDETYFGQVKDITTTRTDGSKFLKRAPKLRNKRAIVSLVERGGKVRSFHVPRADKVTCGGVFALSISNCA